MISTIPSYIAVRIDVTDSLPADCTGGQRVEIAAWIFLPDARRAPVPPSTIALLNGGTYDKRYFHVQVPGKDDYSAADALAARGHLVILTDHLGVSESSRLPDQKMATRQIAALANHAAVSEIYRRLETGTLDPSLPPMPRFSRAGGGHSMGSSQTLAQQAGWRTYDRLLVLGFTAIGVHLPIGGEIMPAERTLGAPTQDYVFIPHATMREGFHWDDVPDEVLAVDEELTVEVPDMLSRAALTMGIATDDAAAIDVPVYICLGEKDVSPRPYDEPGHFTASPDVTLHILPMSGHCQSFASSRMQMVERIDGWLRGLPG